MSRLFKLEMKANAPGVLDMYIYSDVAPDSYDWWKDEVIESKTSAEHFRKELEEAGDVKQINIYINSLGGSVMEGLGIYNQLRRHKAHKTVYIDGFACSIASVIAMAGDEVIMPSSSMMMIHAPLTYVYGNAVELRKAADELDKISLSTMQAYLQKSGGKITAEQLADMYAAEKYWSAAECIEMGLADRMADADIDIDAAIAALSEGDGGTAGGARQQLIEKCRGAVAANATAKAKPEPVPEQVVPEKAVTVSKTGQKEGENSGIVPKTEQKAADFLTTAEEKLNKFFGKEM
ncbi:MAG: head maturation protease, ClpP-related [Oscillospiraceae bacterium]